MKPRSALGCVLRVWKEGMCRQLPQHLDTWHWVWEANTGGRFCVSDRFQRWPLTACFTSGGREERECHCRWPFPSGYHKESTAVPSHCFSISSGPSVPPINVWGRGRAHVPGSTYLCSCLFSKVPCDLTFCGASEPVTQGRRNFPGQ